MKPKWKDTTFLLLLAVVGSILLLGVLTGGVAAADTHNVGPGESIQQAINDADDGDTIVIAEGDYDENIVVNQSNLTIIANDDGAELTAPAEDPAVTINNSVENVSIQNVHVNSSEATAGYLVTENVDDLHIGLSSVSVENESSDGFLLGGSVSNLTLENVNVEEAGDFGVQLMGIAPEAAPRDIDIDGLSVEDVGEDSVAVNNHGGGEMSDISFNSTELSADTNTGISIFAYGQNTDISDISVTNTSVEGDGNAISTASHDEATIRDITLDGILAEDLDTGVQFHATNGGTVEAVHATNILANGSDTGVSMHANTDPGDETATIADITIEESVLSEGNIGIEAAAFNGKIDGLDVDGVLLEDNQEYGVLTRAHEDGTISNVNVSEVLAAGSGTGVSVYALDESSIEDISVGGDDLDSAAALNETNNQGVNVVASDEASVAGLSLENVLLEDIAGTGVQVSSSDSATIDDLEFSTLLAAGSDRGIALDAGEYSSISNVDIGGDDLDSAAALNDTLNTGLSVQANDEASVEGLSVENVLLEDVGHTGAQISSQDHATIDDLEFSTLLAAGSDRGIALDASDESSIGNVAIGGDDMDSAVALNETQTGLDLTANDYATIEGLDLEYVSLEDVAGTGLDISAAQQATVDDLTMSSVLAAGSSEGIGISARNESVVGNISIGGDDMDSAVALNETDTGLSLNANQYATIEGLDLEYVSLEDVNGTGLDIWSSEQATVDTVSLSSVLAAGSEEGIDITAVGESAVSNISIGGDDMDSAVALNETETGLALNAFEDGTIESIDSEFVLLEDVNGSGVEMFTGDTATITDISFEMILAAGSEDGIEAHAFGESHIENISVQESGLNETTDNGLFVFASDEATVEDLHLDTVDLSGSGVGVQTIAVEDSHITGLDLNRVFVDGETGTGIATIADGGTITGTTIQESFLNHTEQHGVILSADDGGTIADTTVDELLLMNNEGEGVAFVTNDGSDISGFDAHTVVAEDVTGIAVAAFGNGSMDEISFEESLFRHSDAGLVTHSDAEASAFEIRDSVFRANDVAVQNHNEDEILDVRLNWWGNSTGPSGDAVDPMTGKIATGDGDLIVDTDDNVNWSPAIGAKAEDRDQFRDIPDELDDEIEIEIEGLSVDDPIELEVEGEVISGPTSDFVGLSAWERAVLPLRADEDDATMTVDIPDTFVRVDEGDAHINRDEAPVYTKGDEIQVGFENLAPYANTERVAGEEVKAIVLKGDVDETLEELLEMDTGDDVEDQLEGEFENRTHIDVDEESGDAVISSDNVSVVEVQELGELDDDGEIDTSITPEEPGDYAILLTTVETGDGIVAEGDDLTFNIFNDTAAMIGADYLMVQETSSSVSPNQTTVSPGGDVIFETDANLGATETSHTIMVFNEAEFADRMVTITDIEMDQADDSDEVIVEGYLDGDPFEMTGNMSDDQGLFTFQGAVNGESFSMTAMTTTDGEFEEASFAGNTTHLNEIDPSGVAGTTTGDDATLSTSVGDRADLEPGESNTYTWVHTATDVDNPDVRSTRKGSITVSEDPVYDLTVNAEDDDGDPLEGVDITIENDATVTAETDADGVTVVQLSNDTYTVTGELDGYEDDSVDVTIDGADEEVTLTLDEDVDPDPTPTPTPPPAPDEFDLTVSVVDQFADAVEDATVTVNGEEETTDADGEVTVSLEEGTYTVTAAKDGYVGATDTVEIDDDDKSIEMRIVERGPPEDVVSDRLNANNASASVNVTAGTPASVTLPDFAVGAEDGIAIERFNVTAIQDIDTDLTFEQSREVPDEVDEVPTAEGGTTFLSVDYDEDVPDSVDEVEFTTRVSQDRLDADDRDAGEVSFYRHNGTDWESIDATVIDEDDDNVYYLVESPGLSVYASTYEEQFEIVDSTVEPTELMVGESADIEVTIENTGADNETFVGDLMIDGDVVDTKEVEIAANETETLNYTHTFEESGEFDVALNNQILDTVTVEAEEYTLTATVEDETGAPLSGATVTVNGMEETTDADGLATFELEDGDYTVSAELDGYEADSVDVTIDGADEEVTLTLEEVVEPEMYELTVNVEDLAGEALSGATVTVDGLEETTDADGLATFELEDGDYTVSAELDGYEADSVDVTIDGADEDVTLSLEEVVEPDMYELSVTVEDTDGDAIEDATVTVDGMEATTGADGLATFELEDGDYTVTATHNDFEEASVDVTIDGADEDVTLTLEDDELLPTWLLILLILLALAGIGAAAYWYLEIREP